MANLLSSAADMHTTVMGGGAEAAAKNTISVEIVSPFRLPSALEVGNATGPTDYNDGVDTMFLGARLCTDSRYSSELTNVDKPSVNRGDLIVAVVPAGADVSDELDQQMVMTLQGGSVYIGTANTDQEEGVYATPFADAVAYAVVGAPVREIREAQLASAIAEAQREISPRRRTIRNANTAQYLKG